MMLLSQERSRRPYREPLLLLDIVAWGRDVQNREERYLLSRCPPE